MSFLSQILDGTAFVSLHLDCLLTNWSAVFESYNAEHPWICWLDWNILEHFERLLSEGRGRYLDVHFHDLVNRLFPKRLGERSGVFAATEAQFIASRVLDSYGLIPSPNDDSFAADAGMGNHVAELSGGALQGEDLI